MVHLRWRDTPRGMRTPLHPPLPVADRSELFHRPYGRNPATRSEQSVRSCCSVVASASHSSDSMPAVSPFLVRGARARQQQSLGQTRVGIGQTVFKPIPIRGTSDPIDIQQLARERISLPLCRPVAGESVKILLDSEQRKCPRPRAGERHRCRNCKLEETPGEAP